LRKEVKQLVAYIASTAAGCRYCQAHTANTAAKMGIPLEKLDAAWLFETDPQFDEAERAALRLARDASIVPNATTAQHFADLRKHFSEIEIVEMVAMISLFGWLNRWNDTLGTPLEDAPLEFAMDHLTAHGWQAGKHSPTAR
jgi:AhpD family alkylhydroperoxidase